MKENNRVVVLFSGNGSNLQALIDKQSCYSYTISGAISNRPNAFGLNRAKQSGIPALGLDHTRYTSREYFDKVLIESIDIFEPRLVVLAGYMRILSASFVNYYKNRLINIHPSLLPDYKGLNTHQRVLRDHQKQHGSTVHFVTEELDNGAIIIQAILQVALGEIEQSLSDRVKRMEHCIYPMAVDLFTSDRLTLDNNILILDKISLGKQGYQLQEQQLISPK